MTDGRSNRASALEQEFTAEESGIFKSRLWALLGRQTEKYTMRDSSSVSIETAEELLSSLSFTLGFVLEQTGASCKTLLTADLDRMVREGQKMLRERVQSVRHLWQTVCLTFPRIENDDYRDTLTGIGSFFRRYDVYFFADRYPETISYPLINPVPESRKGILYVESYLKRLRIENSILVRFDRGRVIRLLESSFPDYRGLCVNLCEQPCVNALGLALTGRAVGSLTLDEEGQKTLLSILRDSSAKGRARLLSAAAERVCSELHCGGADTVAYLRAMCGDLLPRLESALAAGDLSNVFVAFLPENVITSWDQ